MLLGAAFSVRRLHRAQAVQLLLRDAGELPMFAGVVAGNRNNAGKADVGEGETGAGAISATSNVS
jgi:hypothetical protein